MKPLHLVPSRSPHDTGATLDLHLDLDPERVLRAFASMRRTLEEASVAINRGMRSLAGFIHRAQAHLREAANSPQAVAGLEGRYQVRAGLDPAYRSPVDLDALVQSIMAGEAEDTRLLTPASRAAVAAAALRGWTHAHPEGLPILTWHRLVGNVRIEVTRL